MLNPTNCGIDPFWRPWHGSCGKKNLLISTAIASAKCPPVELVSVVNGMVNVGVCHLKIVFYRLLRQVCYLLCRQNLPYSVQLGHHYFFLQSQNSRLGSVLSSLYGLVSIGVTIWCKVCAQGMQVTSGELDPCLCWLAQVCWGNWGCC